MNIMQHIVDGLSAHWKKERAQTQMTLGELIDRLEQLPPDMMIDGLCRPHSYRGYYSDLAFEYNGKMPVHEAIQVCRSCMGEIFEGYKGGDFCMGRDTPVWRAFYGSCGNRIMEVMDDGTVRTDPEP